MIMTVSENQNTYN